MLAYIVSDFHLKFFESDEDVERKKAVLLFFDHCIEKKINLLIMCGDIFDLWYSWKTVIIKEYFPILKKLADLRENNCKIVFIAGNHDFWFDDFLKKQFDIDVYQEYYTEIIDGKNIFAAHGDQYTKNDFRYKVFRKIIRSNFFKFTFELLHPNFGLALGRFMSRSSRSRKTGRKISESKEQGLFKKAEELFNDYDYVIFGHTHKPKFIERSGKFYVNTGDWLEHRSYAEINEGDIKLSFFNS